MSEQDYRESAEECEANMARSTDYTSGPGKEHAETALFASAGAAVFGVVGILLAQSVGAVAGGLLGLTLGVLCSAWLRPLASPPEQPEPRKR